MSNEFLQAADDARRMLRGFAAVEQVAKAFEQVGTLQQAGVEAQAALVKLQADLDATRAKVVGAQAEAADVVARAKVDAQLLVDEAAKVVVAE